MSLIQVHNLTFEYEGSSEPIFDHVTFQMDTNWKLGFIGRNGRGKTTFLNLLLGKYEYQGTIHSSAEFEYFPFEVPDPSRLTIEVIEEMDPQLESWKIYKELNLLEVSEDVMYRPFETLSHGEQMKVLLAFLFIRENCFLLIDEPTHHMDKETREIIAEYLKRKKGFILVSHDRQLLDQVVDHMISINKADIEIQKGNFSSWQENKERRDQMELAQNERLKGEIHRLEEAARRTSAWSDQTEKAKFNGKQSSGLRVDRCYIGHKAAKMMKRSQNIEDRREMAVQEKSKLLKNIETADSLKMFPLSHHAKRLIEARNLTVIYEGREICEPVSFELCEGERVALVGRNGCGKSSILHMILGEDIHKTGQLELAANLKISYVSQSTDHLHGTLTEFSGAQNIDETLFRAILRKLDFSRSCFERKLEELSAGQKKKILLAASLCTQAHLYIWDEPLNYIDILSRIQMEELIEEYQPTLLFVEHDQVFREKVATKVVEVVRK